jgi:hypothetical protein
MLEHSMLKELSVWQRWKRVAALTAVSTIW